MQLKDEIALLEQHTRTSQLVLANLAAARERLLELPADMRRDRLLSLHQEATDAVMRSVLYADGALRQLKTVSPIVVAALAADFGAGVAARDAKVTVFSR